MNFKSQISTTREQSQRLLDLGLNPETADMILSPEDHPMCTPYSTEMPGAYKERCSPSWSLPRLLEMMPVDCRNIYLQMNGKYGSQCDTELVEADNPFDLLIGSIGWLIHEGRFNEEYLIHSNSSKTGKEDNK